MSDHHCIAFSVGKWGHGTKDCDEEDAEDEGVVKYGGWLKASPWKTGIMERIQGAEMETKNVLEPYS